MRRSSLRRLARRLLALTALLAPAVAVAVIVLPPPQPRARSPVPPPRASAPRPAAPRAEQPARPARPARTPRIPRRASVALGRPSAGRLVRGVRLPARGAHFLTWDPVRKVTPNRHWRRFATYATVVTVVRTLDAFAAAHDGAPRVLVGDLSRPRGGDFGRRFGPLGHVSHQNGLDADVYFPRVDGRERAPRSASQVDRALAQDLVDRFVRAGAARVFVGAAVGLRGPAGVVQPWPGHDDHLHVRFAATHRVGLAGPR